MRLSEQFSAMRRDPHHRRSRRVLVLWLLCVLAALASPASAQNQAPSPGGSPTQRDVTVALVLAVDTSPFRATRRIIDISGDGSNNSGRSVTQARDEAVADGIGINGLPILTVEPGLDHYYYDNVIGGPGAFMIPAENYDTFADAILKKLINEIARAEPGAGHSLAPTAASQNRPSLRQNLARSVVPKLPVLTLTRP
jgi:hypothetical protein